MGIMAAFLVSKSAQKNNSAQKSMDSAQKLLDSAQKLIDSAAVLKPRNSAQNSAGTIGTGLAMSVHGHCIVDKFRQVRTVLDKSEQV